MVTKLSRAVPSSSPSRFVIPLIIGWVCPDLNSALLCNRSDNWLYFTSFLSHIQGHHALQLANWLPSASLISWRCRVYFNWAYPTLPLKPPSAINTTVNKFGRPLVTKAFAARCTVRRNVILSYMTGKLLPVNEKDWSSALSRKLLREVWIK